MRIRLLAPDSREWAGFLASTPHDIYHLPEYLTLAGTHEHGEPVALFVEEGSRKLLAPMLIRELEGGGRDAASPYGYAGPLVDPGGDGFLRSALAGAIPALAAEGIVTAFLRFHPLLSPTPPIDMGTVVHHGPTVSIDLSASPEYRWRETRRDHRSQIRKARAAGHVARMDASWEQFGAFKSLYRTTMQRLGASAFYRFDDDYFDALRSKLGDRIHLCVVDIGGSIAAAALFTEEDGIVQYHLSGSEPAFSAFGPAKLMISFAGEWAAARGNRRLHLGGGVGGATDSLFEFKAGFSQDRHRFDTLRLVLDEAEYLRLCSARGSSANPADRTAFFPAYRAT